MEVELYKMTYKIRNNSNELKILGEEFVKNNKNKGFLIIDNKKKKLNSKYDISNHNFSQKKIQMILNRNIFNKSCIFKNCESLESFNTFNESCILKNCESLESFVPFSMKEEINSKDEKENTEKESTEEEEDKYEIDIEDHPIYENAKSKFANFSFISQENENEDINSNSIILYFDRKLELMNGNNYTIIKEMFSNCKSLSFLSDISKWDTKNVIDMSYMFNNCESLSSLPNISKWDTKSNRYELYI